MTGLGSFHTLSGNLKWKYGISSIFTDVRQHHQRHDYIPMVNKEESINESEKRSQPNSDDKEILAEQSHETNELKILPKDFNRETTDKKRPKKSSKRGFISRNKNLIFFFVWLYWIVRFFITDIDLLIITKYSIFGVGEYLVGRLLISFIFLFIVWKSLGNKRFWKNFGLLLAFPVYPGFWTFFKTMSWKIPNFLINNRLNYLLYLYAESTVTLFVKFKTVLLNFFLFITAFLITIYATNELLLTFGIILLLLLQFLHLKKRVNELFGPIKIFQMELEQVESDPKITKTVEARIMESIEESTKKGDESLADQMGRYLIMHEMMKMFDEKLRKILKSQSYILGFILKSFYSFLYAIIIFGCVNYCVFKINPENFSYIGNPELFEFIYYSFFNIFSEGIDIEPLTRISKLLRMMAVSIGVVASFLILGLFVTINSERYKKNLESVSVWTSKFSDSLGTKFQTKFNQNTEEGHSWLKSQGNKFAEDLAKFRNWYKKQN